MVGACQGPKPRIKDAALAAGPISNLGLRLSLQVPANDSEPWRLRFENAQDQAISLIHRRGWWHEGETYIEALRRQIQWQSEPPGAVRWPSLEPKGMSKGPVPSATLAAGRTWEFVIHRFEQPMLPRSSRLKLRARLVVQDQWGQSSELVSAWQLVRGSAPRPKD